MSGEIQTRPANMIDEKILQYAGSHSPEEISALLGGVVSPAKVAAHTQTLLKSRDWLTQAQEEQLLYLRLQKALTTLENRYMDNDNARILLSYFKEVRAALSSRSGANEVNLNALYANQGRLMGRVVDMALSYMKGALREQVDPDLWDRLKEEALLSAQTEIGKYEVEA